MDSGLGETRQLELNGKPLAEPDEMYDDVIACI